MREGDVRERAFAMPLTNTYPPGRYRFVNREFLITTYGTDPEKLARWCRSRAGPRVVSSNTS
jgi:acetoacetate decarboxylase